MAASGHNLYTKSAGIYVQRMRKLQVEHPDIYQRFEEGFYVVRRSNRLWVCRSHHRASANEKHGDHRWPHKRARDDGAVTWLLAMPGCAEVNDAMQELTGVNYNTGEQNYDMSNARQARDLRDTRNSEIFT